MTPSVLTVANVFIFIIIIYIFVITFTFLLIQEPLNKKEH